MSDANSLKAARALTRRCMLMTGIALAASLPAGVQAQTRSVPANDKKCATCDFWGGPRQAAADKRSVIVAAGATGLCGNARSPLYNRMSGAEQGFAEGHRRWRGLA